MDIVVSMYTFRKAAGFYDTYIDLLPIPTM